MRDVELTLVEATDLVGHPGLLAFETTHDGVKLRVLTSQRTLSERHAGL